MRASLKPGLAARLKYTVPEERTVPYLLPESEYFSVMPAVLATGYLVGIVEWACMSALDGHLDHGEQTLGIHVDLSHEAPTSPGSLLTVEATLDAVEGKRLTFSVHAFDEAATVCGGIHRRAVIQTDRFVQRLKNSKLHAYLLPAVGCGVPCRPPAARQPSCSRDHDRDGRTRAHGRRVLGHRRTHYRAGTRDQRNCDRSSSG